jgi:uncharacterized protein YkwD
MPRALVVAVLLVALVVPATAQSGATARAAGTGVERLPALESAILARLNEFREARGLPRLRVAPGLRTAAAAHSRAMLVEGFFAHESSDGSSFDSRVERFYPSRGFGFWRVGENLAAMTGVMTAEDAVDMWLASPPHRRLLIDPTWRDAGLGALRAEATGVFPGSGEASVVTLDVGVRRS